MKYHEKRITGSVEEKREGQQKSSGGLKHGTSQKYLDEFATYQTKPLLSNRPNFYL